MLNIADARKYLFAAISILSIPSAYAAGFMGAIGPGIAILLDGGFFAQEFIRLALICAGFFLSARFSLSLVFTVLKDLHSMEKSLASVFRMRLVTGVAWLLAILFSAPILFLWTILFFDSRLLPSFAVTTLMAVSSALLITSVSFALVKDFQDTNILEDLKGVFTGKAASLNAQVAAGMVFSLVLVSGNFGYHRAIALAISKPVCISTSNGEIHASMIGQTSFGFVVADVKEEDFHPFTFPVGLAILSSSSFAFISAQQDIRIRYNC